MSPPEIKMGKKPVGKKNGLKTRKGKLKTKETGKERIGKKTWGTQKSPRTLFRERGNQEKSQT